jgi:hypothetical protein
LNFKIIIKIIFTFVLLVPIKVFSGGNSINLNPININVGYMSEYWIRGSFQAASVSYINANHTSGPIYLSAGYADLRDRQGGATYNEGEAFISLYGSYNFELMSVPTYIGLAAYRYTDGIDQHYNEISVGADFDIFSVDAVILGDYDTSPSSDYWHFQVSVPMGPINYTYGTYSGAWQYVVHEISTSVTINEIDYGVKLGMNNDNAMGDSKNSNQDVTYGVFSVGYSFLITL